MNYNNKINFRDTVPILKSHHFYTVLGQCFWQLKSLQSNIQNKIYFKDEDKIKQRVYNYCKPFIFQWNKLHKNVLKQSNKDKKNKEYQEFINNVLIYLNDEQLFNQMKQDIENRFWEIKSNYKIPQKKELQIWVDTYLTTKIEKKEFDWFFIISKNQKRTKKIYDNMVIPVKLSEYHKKTLEGKTIKNSLNLKLNKYGKIEITVVYEEEINYPESYPKDILGIDIGLKRLITDSNGEFIKQNVNINKKVNNIVNKQSNRQTLEEHLKVKYNNNDFRLKDKRYLRQQTKVSDYVKNNNRYKIKQYLKSHTDYHIIMEDIKLRDSKTYDKKTNYLLRRLHIQHLKQDIFGYAKKLGIGVTLINPAFTSQQCPICGHISKDNRKTQETFCCVKCGHENNADVNASINIKNRLFEKRIKLNTPFWKVKQILQMK